ncbi:MAG: NfeD family protein [Actinomycetes bacterium]
MVLLSVVWLLVSVALALAGVLRRSVVILPFAAAALLACVSAILIDDLVVSLFVFVVFSLIGRWVIRPALRSAQLAETRAKPGAGTLVGRPALVVERIANSEAVGCVRIDEEIWTARSWDEQDIESGQRVHIVEIRGATAVVSA